MPTWTTLNLAERQLTLRAMTQHGGDFVKALGAAWKLADPINQARIAQAFPNVVVQYGPGSAPYAETARQEAA